MRRILFAVLWCLTAVCAHAAQIVNVDYVHKLIAQKWDITVPIKTDNIMAAANMKYLLTAVDVTNEILNGEKTTDYGNGEFATTQAADTIATNTAVETLIKKEEKYKFFLTITPVDDDYMPFSMKISAAGTYYIDWGDGRVETITKSDTTEETYVHTFFGFGKQYTISIGGQSTAYNTDIYTAAISFYENSSETKIASIDGSLGAIFGTLADGSQPRFYQTFYNASNMKGSIPANLFAGISGAPATYMFYETFNGCSGLTGAIPDGLFAGIYGAPANSMFYGTFYGCSGLTSIPANLFAGISGAPAQYMFFDTFFDCSGLTSIPENLFAGISGAPAERMFENTFYNCSGLTGAIPDGLFAGISGAPADDMFQSTFWGCSGLTSIPENLFGNISGPRAAGMFEGMFWNCTSLTGPSARINGKYLYEIWSSYSPDQFGIYTGCTGLSDYSTMRNSWKEDD